MTRCLSFCSALFRSLECCAARAQTLQAQLAIAVYTALLRR